MLLAVGQTTLLLRGDSKARRNEKMLTNRRHIVEKQKYKQNVEKCTRATVNVAPTSVYVWCTDALQG